MELLDRSLFVVPTYQRPYSWDQYNLNALWDDIESIRDANATSSHQPGIAHFMSSVLIKESTAGRRGQIVDGQQRMMTISLFLLAALSILEEEADPRTYGRLYSDVFNALFEKDWDSANREPVWVPRIILDNQPEDNIFALLSENRKTPVPKDSKHSLSKIYLAFKFFRKQLLEIKREEDELGGNPENSKFALTVKAVLEALHIIYIPIMANESPQKIFESVNGLTKELVAGELVKNYLLMSLSDERQVDKLYRKYWAEFDKEEWVQDDEQKAVFTEYLYYLLISKQRTVSKNDNSVYKAFKEYVGLTHLSPEEVLAKAKTVSKQVHSVVTAGEQAKAGAENPTDRISLFYARILTAKQARNATSAFVKLITMRDELAERFGAELDYHSLDTLLLPVESYITRKLFSVKGYSAAVTKHLINSLVATHDLLMENSETLSEYLDNYQDVLVRKLLSANNIATRWDTNTQLEELLVGDRTKNILPHRFEKLDHHKIRVLLMEVEYLRKKNNKFIAPSHLYSGKYTLEHWMPQNGKSSEWHLTDANTREAYTHSLGNMTILPSELNTKLSNKSLSAKMTIINQHLEEIKSTSTGLLVLDELIHLVNEGTEPSWTEDKMDKRARAIIQEAFTHIYPDAKSFIKEREEDKTMLTVAPMNTIFANPLEGRLLVAQSAGCTVYGVQKNDGSIVAYKATGMRALISANATEPVVRGKQELLEQSERNEDGTYDWTGRVESNKPTALLSRFFGVSTKNAWEENTSRKHEPKNIESLLSQKSVTALAELQRGSRVKRDSNSSPKSELWKNPVEGRELFYTRNKTKVYGKQTGDGKVILTLVENLATEVPEYASNAIRRNNALLQQDAIANDDGTLDWIGETEPGAPSAWLSAAVGAPTGNEWREL